MTSTPSETLSDFITRLGLSLTYERLSVRTDGFSWTRDAKASHWRVTLTNTHKFSMTLEYSKGSAHRRFLPKRPPGWYCSSRYAPEWKKVSEVMGDTGWWGKPVPYSLISARSPNLIQDFLSNITEPTPPTLPEVLDSLASDSSLYDECVDFKAWCEQFGENDDSIKGKQAYDLVGEQNKKFRHLLGKDYDTLVNHIERL